MKFANHSSRPKPQGKDQVILTRFQVSKIWILCEETTDQMSLKTFENNCVTTDSEADKFPNRPHEGSNFNSQEFLSMTNSSSKENSKGKLENFRYSYYIGQLMIQFNRRIFFADSGKP